MLSSRKRKGDPKAALDIILLFGRGKRSRVLTTPANSADCLDSIMVAGVHSESGTRNTLPVCLGSENPHRLVSLWDMLRLDAGGFARVSSLLGQMYMEIRCGKMPEQMSFGVIGPELDLLERNCRAFQLNATLVQVNRAKKQLAAFRQGRGISIQLVASALIEVSSRLSDELGARMIYLLRDGREEFCKAFTSDQDPSDANPVEDSWRLTFASFPSTKYDATEAFKSYAFGRNTACVFHLMRVLEIGLGVLGAVFGVSLAHTNWGPAIEEIEKKIREMHKDPAWKSLPDFKEQHEFYAQSASHFAMLKDAWRNYTAHTRGKYDEQEAFDVMTAVRAFMQKLTAKGLCE